MAHGVKRASLQESREFSRDSGRLLTWPGVRIGAFIPLALALVGCHPGGGPALVQVSGVVSSKLREGDVIELRGESFPEGRAAEVTLRGEISRPGQSKVRRFELSLPGRSVGSHSVAVDVTRPVERTLTGSTGVAHA